MFGRMTHQADLEKQAGLLEVANAVALVQKIAGGAAQLVDQIGRGRLDDARPFAVLNGDQAGFLQRQQGLAHGRAPDPVALHQFALGRERITRLQRSLQDLVFEAPGDLLIDFHAADRLDRRHC